MPSSILKIKLAPKIIILLVIIIFGIMSVYGFFQIQTIKKNLSNDAEKNHIILLANSLETLSQSLWDMNPKAAIKAMNPIFQFGTVKSFKLYDAKGALFTGLQFTQSVDGIIKIIPVPSEHANFLDLNLGDPASSRIPYSDNVINNIEPMINYPNQNHRLISSLWWKYESDQNPRLIGHVVMDFSTEFIVQRTNEQIISFVYLTIGLSLIILILTFSFLRLQVISPIENLFNASHDMSNGIFTLSKRSKFQDEIGKLIDNFNLMVSKIEKNLNVIRAMSDAAQEIVNCVDLKNASEIFDSYIQKLVKSNKVEVWINFEVNENDEIKSLVRISDNKRITNTDSTFQKIILAHDIIEQGRSDQNGELNSILSPLINSHNILVGMIEIFFDKANSKLEDDEKRIIKNLALSLTTSIENYRNILKEKVRFAMERDFELAGVIQDALISRTIDQSNYYNLATFYKAANKCGGDWFGTYSYGEDKLLVLFGDVTGHGVPAALVTAVARGASDMLRQTLPAKEDHDFEQMPPKALEYLNECIYLMGHQTYFMTMMAVLFDFKKQKIYASSAGQTPILHMSAESGENTVKYLYPWNGPRLGFESFVAYESRQFDFKPNDRILLFTDGLTEGENLDGIQFGHRRLRALAENIFDEDRELLLNNIIKEANDYCDGVTQKDDIALMLIDFLRQD